VQEVEHEKFGKAVERECRTKCRRIGCRFLSRI